MTRALLSLLFLASTAPAAAQDATTPGMVTTPHPTIEHISIEWAFGGDVDGDGVVHVRYREAGAGAYRDAMSLFRVPGGANEGFSWATRHAGSLFSLRAGTTYEIELRLDDPDGGSETRTVMAQTRPVPAVADDAAMVVATPSDVDAVIRAAAPGTVVVLEPGTYPSITVTVDGTEGNPIVVRGSSTPDVIVDGEVRMDGRSHVWVENLTVREQIKFNDSDHIVVRGCRVEARQATGDGIVAYGSGTSDGYFADNTVTGQSTWTEAALGASGANIGEGIVMTGPGNVIEHNRVSGFRDCISLLEDGGAMNQVSIDILRNDLDLCADDAIEADFAMGNVRVIQNRMVNSFIALSSQPSLGGPTYFIRNVSFGNVFQVFKPNRGSIGDLWLHNTVIKPGDAMGVYAGREWSRAIFRNNLFIGGTGGGDYNGFNNGTGRVLEVADADEATCDFDYDGYGSIGTGTFEGHFGATRFASLAELRSMTSEANAVSVDLGIFAASFPFPDTPLTATTVPDLRLAAGSGAVDVGEVLPNVNDGFAGAGPDLGAFEVGAPLPAYGPRGPAVCGNGVLEGAESCDDGNIVSGDGCSSSCASEVFDDGGVPPMRDGGSMGTDASTESDAGPGGAGGDGCGCRASGRSDRSAWILLAFAALLVRRRRAWPEGASSREQRLLLSARGKRGRGP